MKDKFYIITVDGVDAPLKFDDLEMAKEQAKKHSDKFGKQFIDLWNDFLLFN